jgi:hypothetical protein
VIITYYIVFQPNLRRALSVGREPVLTAALLEEMIHGCSIVEPVEDHWGPRRVHLQLDRPSREQALSEIETGAVQLGFDIGSVIINEWAGDAGERAAQWLLGDGAVDAAAANPIYALLVALAGTLAKAFVSEEERKLTAQYAAQRLYYGWTFAELSEHPHGSQMKRLLLAAS